MYYLDKTCLNKSLTSIIILHSSLSEHFYHFMMRLIGPTPSLIALYILIINRLIYVCF
jgi:hypothetical protein